MLSNGSVSDFRDDSRVKVIGLCSVLTRPDRGSKFKSCRVKIHVVSFDDLVHNSTERNNKEHLFGELGQVPLGDDFLACVFGPPGEKRS